MPFNSQEFKEFAASYEFEVVTSSHPQSNGKVENTIKTAKNIKCAEVPCANHSG